MKKLISILVIILVIIGVTAIIITKPENQTSGWDAVQTILSEINEPEFKQAVFNVKDYGALQDGSMSTQSIQKAINECSESGGGTVFIPDGLFLTGAIHLKSNVNLHLADNAELLFSIDPADYLPLVETRWEGMECMNYSPLIYAINQENIAITGKGVLNGQANETNWWIWKGRLEYGWEEGMNSQANQKGRPLLQKYEQEEVPLEKRIMGDSAFLRPQFINFNKCKNILLEDITIKNAPFWLIHPMLSENITIRGVTTISHGPNNDGCDPESSKNILIEDCFFNTGDDCIAIKSGRNKDGRKWNVPSENIIIRNCTMENGHGGVVIGSEISGGARNIFVDNCIMDSPELERAIRIKTNSNRGGTIENFYVRNISIGEVKEAVLKINCDYDSKNEGTDVFIPSIKNIFLEGVNSQKSKYPVFILGIEDENCIDSVFISDCKFEGVEMESIIKYAGKVDFNNVIVELIKK